jgi:hypothetical protein
MGQGAPYLLTVENPLIAVARGAEEGSEKNWQTRASPERTFGMKRRRNSGAPWVSIVGTHMSKVVALRAPKSGIAKALASSRKAPSWALERPCPPYSFGQEMPA